jgi:hypothetical protein
MKIKKKEKIKQVYWVRIINYDEVYAGLYVLAYSKKKAENFVRKSVKNLLKEKLDVVAVKAFPGENINIFEA